MALGDTLLAKVDTALNDIFAGWSLSTTIIATVLFFFLAYPWLTWKDPDTHPFLLARQATASPVRQSGESAIYRSTEVPYGYPLRSGLNVKDPGAPKWSSGRNGDLRDIWIQAMRGPLKDDGSPAGPKGKLLTVLGREKVVERSLESLMLEINVIGTYIQHTKGKRVAVCLSNSGELLASIFAASFYGFHPVLIPYGSSTEILVQQLQRVQPDVLITEAGALGLQPVLSKCLSLSQVIWVTKAGNEHMDFAETPENVKGKLQILTWHDLVEEHKSPASSEIPTIEKGSPGPGLSILESFNDTTTVVEYSSQNLISATSALLATLPRAQKFNTTDLLLPTGPLTTAYTLLLTLSALNSHSTIALNSVAGESINLALSVSTLNPTIIIASSSTAQKYHDAVLSTQPGPLPKLSRYWQRKSLVNGNMPKTPSFAPPGRHDFLSKLRLLFVYHRAEDEASPRLSSSVLADLKILMGARTCYALTASGVAGAVAQTNMFDYRLGPEGRRGRGRGSHFGAPVSCVEVLLTGNEDEGKIGGAEPEGKIVVRGPAVVGEEKKLSLEGRIGEDHTLSLL